MASHLISETESQQCFIIGVWPEEYKKENLSDRLINCWGLKEETLRSMNDYLNHPQSAQAVEIDQQINPTVNKSSSPSSSIKRSNNSESTNCKVVRRSLFHNLQKHLNNSLKKLIMIPTPNERGKVKSYQKVAQQIWRIFTSKSHQSKRVLTCVFNQNNQSPPSYCELRRFGFQRLYQTHGKAILNEAKNYLSEVAVRELQEEKVDEYVRRSKVASPANFKRYIMSFKSELQDKFLKKRSICSLQPT